MTNVRIEKKDDNKWIIYNSSEDKKIIIDNSIYNELIQDDKLNVTSRYYKELLDQGFFEEKKTPPNYEKIIKPFYKNNKKNNDIVLLGMPYDAGSTGITGSKESLNKLRLESNKHNKYFEFYDMQNVLYVPGESIEIYHSRIEDTYRGLLSYNYKVLSIGGDHSITYPIIKSFDKKEIHFFKFDAHHDSHMIKTFEKINHSNFMNFIREQENIINIYHYGLREEGFQLQTKKDVIITKSKGKRLKKSGCAYISIDLDVLDLNIFQSTGFLMDNGMSLNDLFKELTYILNNYNVIGIDIVEYNPLIDYRDDYKVVFKIMDFCVENWRKQLRVLN